MTNETLVRCPYCYKIWINSTLDVCINCSNQYELDMAIADLKDAYTRIQTHMSIISQGRLVFLRDLNLDLHSLIQTIQSRGLPK
jgi:DNA-directed RNA polymerase subunit RPC12/RpoP